MMDELKACPFCGSSNTTLDYYEISCPQELGTIVVCNDCGASAKSIGAWNTRPIEDALHARIAELEAEVTKCHELQDSYCDRIAELEGIVKADNLRLINAGLSTGLYSGCDTAEMMAEEILASRARLAELEAERRWRVVADGEFPELGEEVIFYDSIMERRLKGCLRKNGGVEWLSDEGYTFSSRDGRYSRITHWMPLPKLPEVQE